MPVKGRCLFYLVNVEAVKLESIHQIGQLIRKRDFKAALPLLEKLLSDDKSNIWAWKMSGAAHLELGDSCKAMEAFEEGLRLNPRDKELLSAIGVRHYDTGDYSAAQGYFRRVLEVEPSNIKIARLSALSLTAQGRYQEAIECAQVIIRQRPTDLNAIILYAQILENLGRQNEAVVALRQACTLYPDNPDAYYLLGRCSRTLGDTRTATGAYQKAAQLSPNNIEYQLEFPRYLLETGKILPAVSAYEALLPRFPGNTKILNSLANVLVIVCRADEAIEHLKQSIALNPDQFDAYNILGNAYKLAGHVADADRCYSESISLNNANHYIHSNRLLNLNYLAGIDNAALFKEHLAWAEVATSGKSPRVSFDNEPEVNRRLRIGYVSADLRHHAIYYCVEPIIENHDHESFEVFCYYNKTIRDQVTERFMNHSDHWRNIAGLSDGEVFNLITDDKIDILVDLSGHTAGNRLPVFVRKPAPIQVTYECYPHSTGLRAIDYKLTDAVIDTDEDRPYHTEQLYFFSDCFICYKPQDQTPAITALPALKNGYVTFGSFSNLFKINEKVLNLWCEVMKSVDDSRLIFFRRSIESGAIDRIRDFFSDHGVSPSRLTFLNDIPDRWKHLPPGAAHLGLISEVDILLDTFPYSSHTIALEALWQGVPTVTLYGNRHAARVCATLLTAVGLEELIAHSIEEYISIVGNLAQNHGRLGEIRSTLRTVMEDSPLMRYKEFTGAIENAYRDMWTKWCTGGRPA
ncbi:MAG TPA: glycosyltransferase family 41 protein [Gammaproteobacteria bacterium]|nr:glycosyltransferase family 41 protein [Gammaproteobacteria bacterium]